MEQDVRGGPASTRGRGSGLLGGLLGGARQRQAAVAGRRSGVEGRYAGSLRGQGVCSDCFGPLTRRERLLTARMVVLVLLRRLGVKYSTHTTFRGLLPRHLHSARHMGIEAIATLDLARGLRHQVGTPPLVIVPFLMGDTVACLLVVHPL